MADFAARALVALDNTFRARVAIALTRVALRQAEEAQPRPGWTKKRLDLATLVLKDPQGAANRFALILAAQDVPADATDEELETQARDAWDSIAGVGQEDRG